MFLTFPAFGTKAMVWGDIAASPAGEILLLPDSLRPFAFLILELRHLEMKPHCMREGWRALLGNPRDVASASHADLEPWAFATTLTILKN